MDSYYPVSLIHLSPTGNRKSIRSFGLDPLLATGKDRVVWAVEAPAMFAIQKHLRELRGPQALDIWLVNARNTGPWRKWRDRPVWRSSFVIAHYDILLLGTLQSVKPACLNGLAGVH